VLPSGFHRIRHYGLFANGGRVANLARARRLLAMPAPAFEPEEIHAVEASEPPSLDMPCPCCGGRMIIIQTFEHATAPRAPPRFGTGRS
jgi:hypothetical protein